MGQLPAADHGNRWTGRKGNQQASSDDSASRDRRIFPGKTTSHKWRGTHVPRGSRSGSCRRIAGRAGPRRHEPVLVTAPGTRQEFPVMSMPGEPAEATNQRVPEDLAEAGVFPTAGDGFDHGLVVLAMGLPYWLFPSDHGYRLLVEPQTLGAVREQLACFARESVGWPPRPAAEERSPRRLDLFTPLLWALVVLAVFWCQGAWPGTLEEAGILDTQAVFARGEWRRLVTALFLHVNVEHLISNVLSGIFVLASVITTIGRRRGWLLLALAAVAGNLAAAALNFPGPYQSLGASTAIFAGLGLLTGRANRVLRGPIRLHRWRAMVTPLAAGLALLGLFGAGGAHTDVGAHLAGFAAGLVLGFAAGLPRPSARAGT
jgi:membrane associated rhomboid family serine protease